MTNEHLDIHDWDPLSIDEAAEAFRGYPMPWWIAGGWAIDLLLGKQTRPHGDTDILLLAPDQLAAKAYLDQDWVLYKTGQRTPSRLAPWPDDDYLEPDLGIHDVWVKQRVGGPWRFQLMLLPTAGDDWVFRRDKRIAGPIADMGWTTPAGLPVLNPEIQLLYKSRVHDRREKDQADFEAAVPALADSQKRWLAERIRLIYGEEHDWLGPLEQGQEA